MLLFFLRHQKVGCVATDNACYLRLKFERRTAKTIEGMNNADLVLYQI
ncbi:MAG: hypothetical protein HC941_27425 [Microcoleus sp. SU_5_3]|nr:hypothetical protein [Microcoleus sp. SU_5_3]